jgi:hypothetical protein
MAEIYSVDLDGPGLVWGLGDLDVTHNHRVVDAGNAIAGGNALTFEDLFPGVAVEGFFPTPFPGANPSLTGFFPPTVSTQWAIPVVYKNYGGGVHKWNSLITACLTRGVPFAQPVVFRFQGIDASGGPWNITRLANPGGCITLNLQTIDPDDPDFFDPLASLPDGTYSVQITSTGGLAVPVVPFERPGGFFAGSISYTTTGRMAQSLNGTLPIGGDRSFREAYGPLMFKRYNDWNSGFVVANFSDTASGSATVSVNVYGEDGTLFGTFLNRVGSEGTQVYYMPSLPIQLPDGFRGTVIVTVTDAGGAARLFIGGNHVNYERNQNMSFNFIREQQLLGADSTFRRPCAAAQVAGGFTFLDPTTINLPPGAAFVTCLTATDVERRFSRAPGSAPRGTFEGPVGPTTGIRLFNPDRQRNGQSAFVTVAYTDAAGVVFTDSLTTLSIPAFGTGTIFLGADARLPDIYDGSAFIMSTKEIVGMANVVDYRATDYDGSWAYNLPNETGMTQ